MKEYTICVDAISKVFAATGVRVGWASGPLKVIAKMKSILFHMGPGRRWQNKKPLPKVFAAARSHQKYLVHFKAGN